MPCISKLMKCTNYGTLPIKWSDIECFYTVTLSSLTHNPRSFPDCHFRSKVIGQKFTYYLQSKNLTLWYAQKSQQMHLHYVKVDSDERRQLQITANSNSNVISQTAYNGADGNLCHLGDGIQYEGVRFTLFCSQFAVIEKKSLINLHDVILVHFL